MRSEFQHDSEVEFMHQNPNGIWQSKDVSTPLSPWRKVMGATLITLLVCKEIATLFFFS